MPRQTLPLDAVAERLGNPDTWGRLALLAIIICSCAVLLGATLAPGATVASAALATIDEGTDFGPLPDFEETAERSVIVDRDGNVIATLRDENRKTVRLRDVPRHVVEAVLATEDSDFREHKGVNWRAVLRAAVDNLASGEIRSGGSTITQQLVKNTLVGVGNEQTVGRKLREAVFAIELERHLSKDEILERYLNEIYFANRVYGIGTAAEYYWGKEVSELTVAEGALLAGIIRSPEINDPIDHPEAAVARRDIVLDQMRRQGFLSPADVARHQAEPLSLDVHPVPEAHNPFFVAYVRELLKAEPALGADPAAREQALLRGGLVITTTLDSRLQQVAHDAVRSVLTDPEGPQAALPVVDPRTGELLAVGVGPKSFGKGPGRTEVNPALPGLGSGGRQSGSAFKAIGVVAALEAGVPPTYTTDTPSPYVPRKHCSDARLPQPWRPGNYSDGGGGLMDMAAATAKSSNVYFAHLVDEFIGGEKLADTARRLGIRHSTPGTNCAAVLGTSEVFPLDMAAAFATLANQGRSCRPLAVTEVRDRSGRVIVRNDPECTRALDAGVAARATALLRGPVESGTASRNARIGRPAAGKTGTTQSHADAWFVGYIPQLSAAVWVGYPEERRPMRDARCGGSVTGGCLPAMVWSAFMSQAIDVLDLPVERFPTPPPLPTGTVPAVVGDQVDEAEARLREAGFTPMVQTVSDYRPAGEVIAQEPPGGTRLELGSPVQLTVSDGTGEPPMVPNLVGMRREEAETVVRDLGLTPVVSLVPVDDPARHGYVVGQSPAPGTRMGRPAASSPDEPGSGEVVLRVGRPRTADDPPPTQSPTASPSPAPTPSTSPSPTPSPSPSPSPNQPPYPLPTEPV